MNSIHLNDDPYNLIITGVGGQGNVLASRIVGEMLSRRGFEVVIGETFGASQRGGSVMSHLRICSKAGHSPQIPKGRAHTVASMEPAETIRVLKDYGNSKVKVLVNQRPVQPVAVISGEQSYPDEERIRGLLADLSEQAWFIDATSEAMLLGNPIFSNVIMVGALSGIGELPLTTEDFEAIIRQRMPDNKVPLNLKAFDIGRTLLRDKLK